MSNAANTDRYGLRFRDLSTLSPADKEKRLKAAHDDRLLSEYAYAASASATAKYDDDEREHFWNLATCIRFELAERLQSRKGGNA